MNFYSSGHTYSYKGRGANGDTSLAASGELQPLVVLSTGRKPSTPRLLRSRKFVVLTRKGVAVVA